MTEYSIDGEGAISSVLSGTEFHGFDAGGSGRTKKVTAAQIATYVSANLTQSVAATVTAGTTRTQAGATVLTKEINMVTTSTAPSAGSLLGDGVALMTAAAGLETIIINNTANVIQVYGVNGGSDTINGVAGSTGIAIPPNSVEIFFAVATGAWSIDAGVGSSGQLPVVLSLSAITAGTTRTQAGATALTADYNRVDTSTAPAAGAILGDGVKLPASAAGLDIIVVNNTANPIQVYGAGTDTINGVTNTVGVAQSPNSVVLYVCAAAGTWQSEGLGTGFSSGLQTQLANDAMTAHAGGGQGSATAIKSMIARFTTVANGTFGTNDSAVLPASAAGLEITVINAAAANTMDVFPASGENINGLANNTAIPVPAGSVVTFYCTVAGAWHALFTPTGTSVSMRLVHSGGRPPFASAPATDAGLVNATPVSTETYLSEIFVPAAGTATGIGILNGAAVSGNVTVYLLDLSGQQIAKSASTAQSGTTAYQRVNFSAAKFITPGTYYIGLQVDNGTGRYTAHLFGDFGGSKLTGTTYGTFPSGQTMPTTFTANVAPVAHLF
jgi:hypothetical protein